MGNRTMVRTMRGLIELCRSRNGKIALNVVGRIGTAGGGIRTSFDLVPDAPLGTFTLKLAGGSRGLLVDSGDVCEGTQRARPSFERPLAAKAA